MEVPPCVWQAVFGQLSCPRDLLACAQVCRAWRDGVLENDGLWSSLAAVRWRGKVRPPSARPQEKERWFDAFRRVETDARRTDVTFDELVARPWRFQFKTDHAMLFAESPDAAAQRASLACVFLPDGAFLSNVPEAPSTRRRLAWSWLGGCGERVAHDAQARGCVVCVGSYPPLVARRTPDWGWSLSSPFVVLTRDAAAARLAFHPARAAVPGA